MEGQINPGNLLVARQQNALCHTDVIDGNVILVHFKAKNRVQKYRFFPLADFFKQWQGNIAIALDGSIFSGNNRLLESTF